MGLLVLIVVVLGVVFAVQARRADQRLHDARAGIARLRADLVRPDVPQATIDADSVAVGGPARAAADITDGTLWKVAGHLPFLGHAVTSARGTSNAVRDLAVDVLPDVAQAQSQLQTERLASSGGIAVGPIETARPLLATASTSAAQVLARVEALRSNTVIGSVDRARADLVAQLTSLSGQLDAASDAARVLPAMLGGSGTRRYFLGFENESEARALGGLPGAYAILDATGGRLSLEQVGTDSDLTGYEATGVDLGAAYTAEFTTGPLRSFQDSDMSAHFPDAAKIWMGMWKAKTGETLDGALVIDPTALGALLDVTGPATAKDGTVITGENVVQLTEFDAYNRFGDDNDARKAFLVDVARSSADQLVRVGPHYARQLARAAGTQIGERRLLVYSAHPDEESVLAAQPIGGLVPPVSGPNAVTAPYLEVAVNNGGGNKLDYFLDRSVTWTAGGCSLSRRTSTVTITLTNSAPAGLAPYVLGHAAGSPDAAANDMAVLLYTTAGSGLLDATVDGRQVQTASDTDQGRPVYSVFTTIPRGATTRIVVRLLEPTAKGRATLVTQPLVRPQRSSVSVPTC